MRIVAMEIAIGPSVVPSTLVAVRLNQSVHHLGSECSPMVTRTAVAA